MKAAYQKNGLVYRESSSEEDGEEGCPLSPEVIEIDDEEDDDDVIAVGCRKSHWFIIVRVTFYFVIRSGVALFYVGVGHYMHTDYLFI